MSDSFPERFTRAYYLKAAEHFLNQAETHRQRMNLLREGVITALSAEYERREVTVSSSQLQYAAEAQLRHKDYYVAMKGLYEAARQDTIMYQLAALTTEGRHHEDMAV